MELVTVGIVIALATFLNEVPLLIGYWRQTSDTVFLGVVHHPYDYFYYLSQFAIGKNQWFLGFDPFTSEYRNLTLVGWSNVLLGHLFSLVGVPPLVAYHLAVVLLTIIFLLGSYLLIVKIFNDVNTRLVTFILFAADNGLPVLSVTKGFRLSYQDFWFNQGNPLTRLGAVPHQLLLAWVMILTFLLVAKDQKQPPQTRLILFIFLGTIIASINPVQWLLVVAVIIAYQIVSHQPYLSWPKILPYLWPGVGLFIGGLPWAIYLKLLFAQPPYSQLALWERSQQIQPSLVQLVSAYGVVGILGCLGLVKLLKNRIFGPIWLVAIYALLSFGLGYSGLPALFKLSNARFLSSLSVLSLACLAGYFLARASGRLGTKVSLVVVLLVVLLFFPAYRSQIADRTNYFDTNNAFMYLPKSDLEVINQAVLRSLPTDTFLVSWPFNVSFAGLTGRRQFHGHPLLTINARAKDDLAQQFFSNKLNLDQMRQVLTDNQITYVIAYPWTFKDPIPILQLVYHNKSLSLYKVIY